MEVVAACIPIAWLLGTFPTAIVVGRAHGIDITAAGSGNPGASNVMRILGGRAFALVMGADFAKGALAAGAGMAIDGRPGAYVLGVAAVVGHTVPLWRKGGKGIATAGGMVAVLFPLVTAVLAITWALIARVLRKASLASITVTVAYPVLVALTGREWWEILATAIVAAFLVVRHASNIGRLVRGEETDLRGPTAEPT